MNALIESVFRVKYRNKVEDAYTIHIASQGTTKNVKEHVKPWRKIAGASDGTKTLDDFMNDFGKRGGF